MKNTNPPNDEQYLVNEGGLMRCCLQSLDLTMLARQQANETLSPIGDRISCIYCNSEMVCDNGVWKWSGYVDTP